MNTTTHWTDGLRSLDACDAAVDWAHNYMTPAEAWAACERGDWMLWLAGRLSGESGTDTRRPLVLAACACARLALGHVPDGEDRPRIAIEAAEAWARGGDGAPTLDDVRLAAQDAWRASAAASAAASAYAASASATATAAAYAAAYAADADAATLRRCADIVREHYPEPPSIGGAP